MKVYILRHATAEPRSPQVTEAKRRLTPEGKQELKVVLRQARQAGVSPQVILTSPWVRAAQTAQMAAKALRCEKITETKALLPDVPPAQVLQEIRALEKTKADNVMVAGHEPQLSRLAAFLLEAPVSVDLKKGGMMRIDIEANQGPPRGVLKWMLTPRLAGKK